MILAAVTVRLQVEWQALFPVVQHCSSGVQRRSRRNLALKRTPTEGSIGSSDAVLSKRRLSLEKAQSRKSVGSQQARDSRQTLEGNGVADGHQKPSGTTVNPLADVETGQMHLDSAMETGDMQHARNAHPAGSSNAGMCFPFALPLPPYAAGSFFMLTHMCALLAEKLRSAGSSMRKPGGNSFKESNVEKGMILPFTPLTMTFHDVHYFVDCPSVCQSDAPYHISARTSNLVFLIHYGSNTIRVRLTSCVFPRYPCVQWLA